MADVIVPMASGGIGVPALTYDWANGQVVAIGSGSLQSAAINSNFVVTLTATSDCWFAVGSNPTAQANTAGNDFLPAGTKWTLSILKGQKIAVIQNASSGNLVILPALSS